MRKIQKKNHNRVGPLYVIKIRVPLYVKKKLSFFGLRQTNFQTFFANLRIRWFILEDI